MKTLIVILTSAILSLSLNAAEVLDIIFSTAKRVVFAAMVLQRAFIALCIGICAIATPVTAADFTIAPNGDDAGPGTLERPFASLQRARDAVREVLKGNAKNNIVVQIRGGTYRLSQTVVFGLEDSAAPGQTVTYAAYPGETPVFCSGVVLDQWKQEKGKLWSAPVPRGAENIKTLYKGMQRLPRARCLGFKPTEKAKSWTGPEMYRMNFPKGAITPQSNMGDVELLIRPAGPWSMNLLPLAQVDFDNGVATTAVRGTYLLMQPRFGHFVATAWIENGVESIDEGGEWAIDRGKGRIFYQPKGDRPGNDIAAPLLTEIIRIEGDIDEQGPKDVPVRGLVFRGLTFTQADRYSRGEEHVGLGLQHDWELFDHATAMVRLRGAEDCRVEQCTFSNAGSSGIRLDLHCQNNRIFKNLFHHLGGVGILLAGYGPGTKDVNRGNWVLGNHIHNIGEIYWHSPAIFVWQSGGNRVANNLIHNTPYSGIVVSGRISWDLKGIGECSRTVRWHEVMGATGGEKCSPGGWEKREPFLHGRGNHIERNDIHHVMEVMKDGNGIYISGTGANNVVRENFVHDCPSKNFAEGIRCDDDQYETLIERNIVWKLGGMAGYITIKGRNHVINNILACTQKGPGRAMLSLEFIKGATMDGCRVQRNIFYSDRPAKILKQGRNYYGLEAYLRDGEADHNLYWNTADPQWGVLHLKAEQEHGSEKNSRSADPLFVDAANGNFSLKKNSPALKMGFEPIDMSLIGPKGLGPQPHPSPAAAGGKKETK